MFSPKPTRRAFTTVTESKAVQEDLIQRIAAA
jgi:hypothetical protein